MTYLWQEERGCDVYRVQTDEPDVVKKLKRRNKFSLSAVTLFVGQQDGDSSKNTKTKNQALTLYPSPRGRGRDGIWIFVCRFARPDIARKTLKNVTGKKMKIDSEGIICYE